MLRIEEILKEKGLTKGDLAESMGISRQTLHSHLTGNPSLEILNRIAKALNVTIAELFDKTVGDGVIGIIRYKDRPYEINSIQDIEQMLEEIKKSDN